RGRCILQVAQPVAALVEQVGKLSGGAACSEADCLRLEQAAQLVNLVDVLGAQLQNHGAAVRCQLDEAAIAEENERFADWRATYAIARREQALPQPCTWSDFSSQDRLAQQARHDLCRSFAAHGCS